MTETDKQIVMRFIRDLDYDFYQKLAEGNREYCDKFIEVILRMVIGHIDKAVNK